MTDKISNKLENEPDIFAALSKAGRITCERGRLVVDANKFKVAKLRDIISRAIEKFESGQSPPPTPSKPRS